MSKKYCAALWQPLQEKLSILRKQYLSDVRDRVRNKEGGQYIDGIMQMRKKNDDGKNDCGSDKKDSQADVIPKNERHEERQSRMPRKEEVAAKAESTDEIGFDDRLRRKWSNMCEANKYGTNENKECDRLKCERHLIRLPNAQHRNEHPE